MNGNLVVNNADVDRSRCFAAVVDHLIPNLQIERQCHLIPEYYNDAFTQLCPNHYEFYSKSKYKVSEYVPNTFLKALEDPNTGINAIVKKEQKQLAYSKYVVDAKHISPKKAHELLTEVRNGRF